MSTHHNIIKICGLSTPDTLESAINSGADMVGFVFFPKSPRHASVEYGAKLAKIIQGRCKLVALTVDADDALLTALIDGWKPDVIQCHGTETPERMRDIRVRFDVSVMKALGVAEKSDLAQLAYYAPHCDMLLVDAKPPKNATLPGGNGVTFDWTLLKDITCSVPLLLSGGLTPENVGDAIAQTRAHGAGINGVDVSSGVESAIGVKDPYKMKLFIENAKRAFAN